MYAGGHLTDADSEAIACLQSAGMAVEEQHQVEIACVADAADAIEQRTNILGVNG